jgi:hypothetical protein
MTGAASAFVLSCRKVRTEYGDNRSQLFGRGDNSPHTRDVNEITD